MTITKGAADRDRFRRPAFFYGSAREAFGDFLDHGRRDAAAPVLLPAFIGWSPNEGSGVFDPVGQRDLSATFYKVNRDLTADVDDLARCLEERPHSAIVLIHYYGRTDPALDRVRALADQHGIPLVEDNAHAFFTAAVGGVAGSRGDLSIYSLHKMFPLPAGGMAVYRAGTDVEGRRSTDPGLATEILSYDWAEVSRARRSNFLLGTGLLEEARDRGAPLELIWPVLAETDVPQTLPLYVLTGTRDELYGRLNAAGLGVVSLYHTLIPQLREEFPASSWSASHVLNLPVHQDVEPGQMHHLVATLENLLSEPGLS
ncbi:DegT/DnrJ/EryC1/StrS family aminotransferase [Blastococcus sp. SYSU DS0552]